MFRIYKIFKQYILPALLKYIFFTGTIVTIIAVFLIKNSDIKDRLIINGILPQWYNNINVHLSYVSSAITIISLIIEIIRRFKKGKSENINYNIQVMLKDTIEETANAMQFLFSSKIGYKISHEPNLSINSIDDFIKDDVLRNIYSRDISRTFQVKVPTETKLFYLSASVIWFLSIYYIIINISEIANRTPIQMLIAVIFFVAQLLMIPIFFRVKNDTYNTYLFRDKIISSLYYRQKLSTGQFNSEIVERRSLIFADNITNLPILHELLPSCSTLDSNIISSKYTIFFVVAWILPVLGFMGTASGMSQAIGKIDSMARGASDDLNDIIGNLLGGFMPGLATAFDTTIFALAMTLIVYFCTNALKYADQSNLDILDSICLELLSAIILPINNNSNSELGSIAESLSNISSELKQILSVPDHLKQIVDSSNIISEKLSSNINNIGESIIKIDNSLKKMNETSESLLNASKIINAKQNKYVYIRYNDPKDWKYNR